MNAIDIVLLFVLLIFCTRGYLKGFINELFSIFIIILSLAGAFIFYSPVSNLIEEFIRNKDLSLIISFFAIFILVAVVLVSIRNTLVHVVDRLNLTDVDYLLGIIIGLLKGIILCGGILLFIKKLHILNLNSSINESVIFPYVERVCNVFISVVPDTIKEPIQDFFKGRGM